MPKESIIVSYNFTFFLFLLTIKWNSEIVPPDGHSLGVTAPVVRDKKLTVNSKIYQINLRLTTSSRVLSNLWKIKHWKWYGAVKLLFFPELGILMKLDLARGQALPPFFIWSSHPVAKIKALFCFQFPIVVIVWCLCTYWLSGRAGWENIWPEVTAYGPSAMTEGQIFSRLARPNSVNEHFIIWPPRFSFFPFFFYFFFFGQQNSECCSFWPKSRDLYSNKVVLVRFLPARS